MKKIPLSISHPELAEQWHPTKNGSLSPSDVMASNIKRVWWQCAIADDHIWEVRVCDRVKGPRCPYCLNLRLSKINSLHALHTDLAKRWHPSKNNPLTPNTIIGTGQHKKYWWLCEINPEHEWEASIASHIRKDKSYRNCPLCDKSPLSISHPEIAAQWHPAKNGLLKPEEVRGGSATYIWWICPKGPDHEWRQTLVQRTREKSGCPYCDGKKLSVNNSLAYRYPELAKQWHFKKNGPLKPEAVFGGGKKKYWWKCPVANDHEWEASIQKRATGQGCPVCRGLKIVKSNCLATTHPDLAAEWHETKNSLTPYKVIGGSEKPIWWQCSINQSHQWLTSCKSRTNRNSGCPYCNSGWTIDKMRLFVHSILPYLDSLTPAELYVLFQQQGILNLQGKAKAFIQAFKTGKFPKEELEKFVLGKSSLVDEIISQASDDDAYDQDKIKEVIAERNTSETERELPLIQTKDVLTASETIIKASMDSDAINFFIRSAAAKIWQHVFIDESAALSQLEWYKNDAPYPNEIKCTFLEQYYGARDLQIAAGYNFNKNGKLCPPNLMQRFTAWMVKKTKRFGNWSGTGAGKTLSAILASRVIEAKLTIICCPNSVVDHWKKNIEKIYPDSIVITKDTKIKIEEGRHHYVVLNYEFFQQPRAEAALKKLLSHKVNFVVIDEIHYSKQRVAEDMSKRRKVIAAMLSEAAQANEDLHVLGMSATPVINNLFEGKTLIELVTGLHHDDLDTKPTVNNCNRLYQKFVSHGIRWVPRYEQSLNVQTIEIDCSHLLDEVRNIKGVRLGGSMVDLEAVLTKAKIPEILKNLKSKTIVYTFYVKNIVSTLQEAIEIAGWRTAVYSGDDKTGLEKFLHGNADILIATSCIGTGVDGLQDVCNRIIVNTLPWTHAEFEQLKGRVYRQGQKSAHVDIIVPLTYIIVDGNRWSWCMDSRWKRIQFKKSISDAAVDGVIPEGHLRTPAQAYKDAMLWLERLDREGINEIERRAISIPLSSKVTQNVRRTLGDLTQMNAKFNRTRSDEMHKHFQKNPDEWEYYHSVYREDRQNWPVVPYQEAIKWCKLRPELIIGDFGCGEALLSQEVENQIHSFDHVAINNTVIAGDMSHVPLDDTSIDAAIFSLSLMGSNYIDYLREARRCLKFEGRLWIAEPTSRIQDIRGRIHEIMFL